MSRRLLRPTPITLSAIAAISLCAVGYGLRGLSYRMQLVYAAGVVFAVAAALVAVWLVRRRGVRGEGDADDLTGLPGRARLLTDLEQTFATASPDRPVLLVLLDLVGFKEYNDTYGHLAGDALLKRLAKKLTRVVNARGSAYRLDGDEFAVLLETDGDAGQLADLAATALVEEGDGFAVAPCYGTALLPHDGSTASDVLRVANERMYALKYALHPSSETRHSSEVLMDALAQRGPDRGDHLHGLAELVEAVARKLGAGIEELEQVRLAAELHDVGKAALPSALLEKSLPLDDAEREYIQRHSVIGERILHAAPALHTVARLIRWSHERYDGAGYPDHLSGREIPLGARIISVCDAFDAMISNRPYRDAKSVEEAVNELRQNAGSQFDPAVVDAFCGVMKERERFFLAA